jgi:hypothetical protein
VVVSAVWLHTSDHSERDGPERYHSWEVEGCDTMIACKRRLKSPFLNDGYLAQTPNGSRRVYVSISLLTASESAMAQREGMAEPTFQLRAQNVRRDATCAFNDLKPTQDIAMRICDIKDQVAFSIYVHLLTSEGFALLEYYASGQSIRVLTDLMLEPVSTSEQVKRLGMYGD